MTASPRYRVGVVSVLVASVLWGTTGTAATFAPGVSPVAIGATAMGVGGLLQALIAWPAIRRNLPGLYRQGRIVALGVVAVAVYPLAFYTSMHLAGVAAGTVVSIGSAPVFASIVERVADHHRLTRRWLVGAGLGIGGATLLCLAESQGSTYGGIRNTLLGVVLGFLAGLTYALYSWTAHRVMATGIPPRAAMGSIFGSAGVLLMPDMLVTGAPLLAFWTNTGVGIYLAVIPMFAGYVLFGVGLARVQASTAIVITLVEPIIAALLAVVIVGEHLPLLGWVGAALIVSSLVALTVRLPRRRTDMDSQKRTSTMAGAPVSRPTSSESP